MKARTRIFTNTDKIDMKIINKHVTIKDISEGYVNNSATEEGGVFSMNGRLNIRPRYQREYIIGDKNWKVNLINSILKGFPTNKIYIGVCGEDENTSNLEVIDGQQRIITICDFIIGRFSIKTDEEGDIYFDGLDNEHKNRILTYTLDISYCIGDESARIKWFKRINQPTNRLEDQELRNATYVGTFLESAKRFFCASSQTTKEINDKNSKYCITRYSSATKIDRCEFLEVALNWAAYLEYEEFRSDGDMDERICQYMAEHQRDEDATKLINTYKSIIDWVMDVFWHGEDEYPSYDTFKKVDWGRMYCEYKDKYLSDKDKRHITEKCMEIVDEGEVTKISGIYEWVIRGEKKDEISKYLEFRRFSATDIKKMYAEQKGIDPIDGKHYNIKDMEAHHIIPWSMGGKTSQFNSVMLSKENHKRVHAGFITPDELKQKRNVLLK